MEKTQQPQLARDQDLPSEDLVDLGDAKTLTQGPPIGPVPEEDAQLPRTRLN